MKNEQGAGARPTEPFPRAEYLARMKRLERELARRKIDAMVVLTDVNRLYLTGFPSSNGLLIVIPGARSRFQTDFRYLEAAENQLRFLKVEQIGRPADQLAPLARRRRWKRIAYEGAISAARLQQMRDSAPMIAEWIDASDAIRRLRAVKSRREIQAIRAAVRANDTAFERLMSDATPGMTEWDLRRILRRHIEDVGQEASFDAILATGPNSSRCHHRPSARLLGRRDILLVDMGTTVQSYRSDLTRVVHFGRPSAKFMKIYTIVLEANRKAIAAIRPGRKCRDIDAVARNHIAKAGFGKFFGHGLGHGIGLEVHESPSFSSVDETRLTPGMVLTVEPGIYLPGFGGVRIEDVVVVTRNGCEVLTRTPKDPRLLRGVTGFPTFKNNAPRNSGSAARQRDLGGQ